MSNTLHAHCMLLWDRFTVKLLRIVMDHLHGRGAALCQQLLPSTTTNQLVHCRLVTPPADAAVHTMLKGPWSSAGFAGPESIVVPAAGLAPGQYTVQLTATRPFTTFTLQVGYRSLMSCSSAH